jgi:RNA polymerase sigma-70 factor (ECF subfamily)
MDLVTLVNAARSGDRAAFGAIVRRFQDMAFRVAYSWLGDAEDARDAAQDAFIEAWQSLKGLQEAAAFPGWFRCIVRKHADRRQRVRRRTTTIDELHGVAAATPDPLQMAEQGEMRRRCVQPSRICRRGFARR